MEDDPKAASKDAFTENWLMEYNPCINPPWYLIPKCVENIIQDNAIVMFVVPKWELAKWWPRYCDLCLRHTDLTEAIYMKPDLTLWNKPNRETRIGILDGTRHTGDHPTHGEFPSKGHG